MSTERPLPVKLALWFAEVVLALLTLGIIVATWLPIDGFRAWLGGHFGK